MSDQPEEQKVPWSFVLLLVAAAIYLGFRAIQGIGWLVDWVQG